MRPGFFGFENTSGESRPGATGAEPPLSGDWRRRAAGVEIRHGDQGEETRAQAQDEGQGGATPRPLAFLRRWLLRALLGAAVLAVLVVLLFRVINPPVTHTIWSEARRLGGVEHSWVEVDGIAPVMLRSAVAAEDANFCTHWGSTWARSVLQSRMAPGAAAARYPSRWSRTSISGRRAVISARRWRL
ncbi:hypothetical protein KU6B_07470 [Mameliella alba]|nr:hypothetical protein KU6B_07470 [Mameliella alba]